MIAASLADNLKSAILSVANPRMIILFGSQARGTADEDSDVDLLVVEEKNEWSSPSRRREIGRIRRALPRIGFPIDVLLFTPSEVAHWRSAKNHVIARAVEEGHVLYERA
jgi:predicted nucleotidyltransferase